MDRISIHRTKGPPSVRWWLAKQDKREKNGMRWEKTKLHYFVTKISCLGKTQESFVCLFLSDHGKFDRCFKYTLSESGDEDKIDCVLRRLNIFSLYVVVIDRVFFFLRKSSSQLDVVSFSHCWLCFESFSAIVASVISYRSTSASAIEESLPAVSHINHHYSPCWR